MSRTRSAVTRPASRRDADLLLGFLDDLRGVAHRGGTGRDVDGDDAGDADDRAVANAGAADDLGVVADENVVAENGSLLEARTHHDLHFRAEVAARADGDVRRDDDAPRHRQMEAGTEIGALGNLDGEMVGKQFGGGKGRQAVAETPRLKTNEREGAHGRRGERVAQGFPPTAALERGEVFGDVGS